MTSARILAVDDDSNQLSALKRILRRSHFEVATCANPRQGLQQALDEAFDLILLDVCMPGLSGHEFIRRLHRAEARKLPPRSTPVIFLTGLDASHQRVSGLDAGAEDYVTKPYDADELRARIRSRLRHLSLLDQRPLPEMDEDLCKELEETLGDIRQTLEECETPLSNLDSNLELAGMVRQPGLQSALLVQAKRDVRKLADSLSRLSELPDKKGTNQ